MKNLKEIKLGRKDMNVKRNNTIARAHTNAANINQEIEDSAMKHYRESLDDLRDSKK